MAETGVVVGNVVLMGRELAAVLAGPRVYQASALTAVVLLLVVTRRATR